MALLWFDGFESYQDYTDFNVISSPFILSGFQDNNSATGYYASSGRRGGRCLKCGAWTGITYTLNGNYVTGVFGIAAYMNTAQIPTYNSNGAILQLIDDDTTQVNFYLVGTELQARDGSNTLLGTTVGAGITYETWRYLEFKVTIDGSSGAIIVRANGEVILNLSGIDTQVSANAYFNKVRIEGGYYGGSVIEMLYSDFYMCDTTGSKNNDFLGDVRVDVIRPDGAGTYSQFTPLAGSNYENVDETYPDGDTTYNDGDTPGNKDSYAMSSLTALGTTIHGVKNQITVRKTDAGSKNVKLLTKSGSTEALDSSTSLSDTYTTPAKVFEDNPDDSAAWEEADVNAMEVGIQIATTTTTSTTSTTTTTA